MWGTHLIEDRIEKEIQKGFDSPVNGWVMSEILELFKDNDRDYARDYILNRCNIM